ncbi:MAG: hypothetical protein HQL08_00555 [Nitrospirae bacterium]|nr:hypothetical protein [Nitrospirota bacterium]
MKKIVFNVSTFLIMALCSSPSFALVGDGGTIAACYPGGYSQILLGVKPFVFQCAQYTVIKPCPYGGKLVEFWLPTYAIEVTGQANTTVFPVSLADVLSLASPIEGGMVQGEAGNDTQTKYRDVHVYQLSTADVTAILAGHPGQVCMLLYADSITGGTVFKSELFPGWRIGKDPTGLNPFSSPVGSWGPLYPRTGWSNHPSNVTNSLLLSYRSQQLGAEFSALYGGTVFVDKYEIGGPVPGDCYQIGTPTMLQEKAANRSLCADRIVTIFWRHIITCCPV